MSQRSTPIIHPFLFFLVDSIQQSFTLITTPNVPAYMNSLQALYWLTMYLDSSGQQKLAKEIKQMEDCINGQAPINPKTFRQIGSAVMRELHDEGYFLAAKMRPPTRQTDMKEIRIAADRARLG